jgi:outer membrane protein assembly factor BamB
MDNTAARRSSALLPNLARGLALALCTGAAAQAADPVDPSSQPWGYLAPIELSDRDLEQVGSKAYRTWFENGVYQGDLVEYDVSVTGALSTSIDLSGPSPENTDPFTNWSAHLRFEAKETADPNWWDAASNPAASRKVISWTGNAQIPFQWNSLTDAQQQQLDPTAAADGATRSAILDFVRGDRSNETANSGNLRTRLNLLGDIVHSNPVHVGRSKGFHLSQSYIAFANDNLTRAERVYVGANDGMLHAFDAATGNEVWAYVPSTVLGNLDRLVSTSYEHTYFVDGELTATDAELTTDNWRTVLVGSLGAGGKGVFALDVTNPNLSYENSTGAKYSNNRKVLWELTDSGDNDLGHTYGRPVIARFNDGKWYAAIGNGYNSASGRAVLYLVNLHTGNVTKVFTGSIGNNGLSGPALVDLNADGMIDVAYAGDLHGKLWKFALPGNEANTAIVPATPTVLHDAGQPITAAPDVARQDIAGVMVYFATGRLLTSEDLNDDTVVNAAYGIWDRAGAAGSGGLYTTSLSEPIAVDEDAVRSIIRPAESIDLIGDDANTGWKLTFQPGDRVVVPVQVRAGRVKMTVINPVTQENWVLEPNIRDGGPAAGAIFDLNGDGELDALDLVDGNADGDTDDSADIPMGWQMPNGLVSRLTIARVITGRDTAFFNNLVLPVPQEICIGNCVGGIEGGHFDLDTDGRLGRGDGLDADGNPIVGNGFGNTVSVHSHEYDDIYNTTVPTFTDLEDDQLLVQEAIEAAEHNDRFIVLLSNADLSIGGTLTIGNKTWNVAEYQAMLHRRLRDWDGSGDLTDDDGDSLLFTVNQILGRDASGAPAGEAGTLAIGFGSGVIRSGGLHPTGFECVVQDHPVSGHNGRWRNGALIMQLAAADAVIAGIPAGGVALDALTVQAPGDLRDPVYLEDGTPVFLSDDNPSYPTYGGVRIPGPLNAGADPAAFLYEAAIYWHYDGDPCYGEPGWEEAVEFYIQGLSEEDFLNQTGLTVEEFLAINPLELYPCATTTCADEFLQWWNASQLIDYVNIVREDPIIDKGAGFDDDTGAGLTIGDLTPPPKGYAGDYRYGRQGWSDVSPE